MNDALVIMAINMVMTALQLFIKNPAKKEKLKGHFRSLYVSLHSIYPEFKEV